MGKNKVSIRWQIILLIILIQIPLCVLFYFNAVQTVRRVDDQLASAQKTVLSSFSNLLQEQMQEANSFLYLDCWQSENLCCAGQELQWDAFSDRLSEEAEKARELISGSVNLEAVNFYAPGSGNLLTVTGSGIRKDPQQERLINAVMDAGLAGELGWQILELDDKHYFIQSVLCGDVYVFLDINLSKFAVNAIMNSSLQASVACRSGNRLLNDSVWTRGFPEDTDWAGMGAGADWYFVENPQSHARYQVIEHSFAGMTICMGTLYQYNWSWLYYFSAGMAAVLVLTLTGALLYLRRSFFQPLNRLVEEMEHIGSGERPTRELPRSNREFAAITRTFLGMLDTLEHQKITAYEHALRAQQMKTDALRLQIRRHFFLNCLKNIYALTRVGDLQAIQDTVMLLSGNLRYTLNFYQNSVSLESEIAQCSDYLQLQGIGQPQPPRLKLRIRDELKSFQIPPVSLLTMLENCCKYGSRQDAPLEISISASVRTMDENEIVCIAVQDNGLGFPEEKLMILNNRMDQMEEQGHVGIVNTMERLRMMYGPGCEVLFSNRGGARVEWMIPMPRDERRGEDDEASDR